MVNWILGIGVAPLIGVMVGLLAERVPMPDLARSMAAAFVSQILITAMLIWVTIRFRLMGPDTVISIGPVRAQAAWLGVVCAAAAVLHVAAGHAESVMPFVAHHRPTILAGSLGLCMGLSHARTMAVLNQLPACNEL